MRRALPFLVLFALVLTGCPKKRTIAQPSASMGAGEQFGCDFTNGLTLVTTSTSDITAVYE